jgi:hypothetical protein
MALSPQYSWPEPDNSSLVKNGAQDIRALGDAIDTSVWNIGFGQAGKNKIINGDFSNWQRGTTLNYTSSGLNYLADRFFSWTIGTLNVTISQQAFTPGTAPVAGYEAQYFLRNTVTSLSGQSIQAVGQRIEDVRTFAGQPATLSFWAKADSARTYTTRFIQNFGSGGSSEVQTSGGSHSLTTSWQRFSVSVTIPSVSGKTIGTSSYLQFLIDGPANTANTLDIWGVQLEYGSKMTPFETASGFIQSELALCQRYYHRTSLAAFGPLAIAATQSTTAGRVYSQYPVTMRTAPSFATGGTITLGTGSLTSVTGDRFTTTAAMLALSGSSFIAGGANFLYDSGSATAYFEFSSEL